MDKQIIEVIGQNWLINQLLKTGLEVSLPVRDRGIDLIVYLDILKDVDTFISCPIQMKASSKKIFGLDKKYKKFPNLIITYVWNVNSNDETVCYALTYNEVLKIFEEMGYTKTESWEKGKYVTTKPSIKLVELLEPYKMSPKKWKEKLFFSANK